jgi:hypothetical protein
MWRSLTPAPRLSYSNGEQEKKNNSISRNTARVRTILEVVGFRKLFVAIFLIYIIFARIVTFSKQNFINTHPGYWIALKLGGTLLNISL